MKTRYLIRRYLTPVGVVALGAYALWYACYGEGRTDPTTQAMSLVVAVIAGVTALVLMLRGAPHRR